jgi:hypothetical protein
MENFLLLWGGALLFMGIVIFYKAMQPKRPAPTCLTCQYHGEMLQKSTIPGVVVFFVWIVSLWLAYSVGLGWVLLGLIVHGWSSSTTYLQCPNCSSRAIAKNNYS